MSTPTPAIAVLDAIGTHMTFHNPSLPIGLPTLRELAESLRLDEASAEGLLQQAINEGDVEEPRRERGHYKLTAAGKAKWDEHLAASDLSSRRT
jgi:DNA-binding MarR family transcriptional regulator